MALRIKNIKVNGKRITNKKAEPIGLMVKKFLTSKKIDADVDVNDYYGDRWKDIKEGEKQ